VLSTSKVFAGGLAAATTAVLGSYFGVFGTVGGAAVGSVATAVSSEFYQRSIERTAARLRPRTSTAPLADGPGQQGTGRRRGGLLVGTLLIFVLGIGVVTGIEWATGGPLSGGAEATTSLGDVLHVGGVPVIGDLLGGTSPDSSSDGGSTRQHHPGLVGGLLSGL
jgi:hypothetical protein